MTEIKPKILFCRVSWKKEYKTEPGAWNGGQFVIDHGEGGERHNFLPFDEYCYGYFQPIAAREGQSGADVKLNINRLGANKKADSIDNINIIWVATHRYKRGRWIVGVYKNAVAYRQTQFIEQDTRRKSDAYRVKAKERDSFLVPEYARDIKIPDGMLRYRPGVCYEFDLNSHPEFSNRLARLLKTGKKKYEKMEKEEIDRVWKYGKGGESAEHKKLKGYARKHPELFEVATNAKCSFECLLPSGDRLDVLFEDGDKWVAVEVKSCKSDDSDLERGVYQCVKYRAVLQAMKKAQNYPPKLDVFLLLEKPLPQELKQLSKDLGVKVKLRQ